MLRFPILGWRLRYVSQNGARAFHAAERIVRYGRSRAQPGDDLPSFCDQYFLPELVNPIHELEASCFELGGRNLHFSLNSHMTM